MPAQALDPNFFHAPATYGYFQWPPRPLWVTGYIFDPATRTFDFSAVPGFDLARLQGITHVKSGQILYSRTCDPPCGFAEVDGVRVVPLPTSGTVLKVTVDTSAMSASDEMLAFYDPATSD